MEVFEITEFVPLYDEENGALMAGIRFWQINQDKPLRATLYEINGITEYIQKKDSDMAVILVENGKTKRTYITYTKTTKKDGSIIYNGENYPTFPIVPLKNNELCKSELCGKRNTIDALDLACSNMVNNVDEGNVKWYCLKLKDVLQRAITGAKPPIYIPYYCFSLCLCADVVRQMCAKKGE